MATVITINRPDVLALIEEAAKPLTHGKYRFSVAA
jgi:hypothetical protein